MTVREQGTTQHSSDPPTTLEATFARHGWAQDLRYSADGPDGSDIGMRRLDILCIVMTRSNGDDDEDFDGDGVADAAVLVTQRASAVRTITSPQ